MATCVHHYIVDTPNGPTSQGTCKLCGKEGTFSNNEAVTTYRGNLPDQLENRQVYRAKAKAKAKAKTAKERGEA